MRKLTLSILAGSAALAMSSPASAATIIACGGGSNCLSGTTNVNLVDADNTDLGTGTIGMPGPEVTFTTEEDGGLDLEASGQATISAGDEGTLTSLTFNVLTGFTAAEFNLSPLTGGGPQVQFGVSFTSNLGITNTSIFPAPLGDQRFAILAAPGETITSVTISSAEGFGRFTQLRVGTGIVAPIPEPGTWAMLILGFGTVGFAMRRRSASAKASRRRLTYA